MIAIRLSPPSVIGAATSFATGRIDFDAGTVLPTTVDVTFNGVGPTPVVVDSAGLFGFGLRGPPGQNRVAGLTVSVTAAQGRIAADAGVIIDTPPLVEIEPRPPGPRAPFWEFPDAGVTSETYRLTDSVTVRVTSETGLPVDVMIGGKPAMSATCMNCSAPSCGCFQAIPEDVSVPGLTRPVSVFALIRDGGSQPGLAADGGAPTVMVTRLRWRQQLPAGVVVAPLIDDEGTLFVSGDAFDGGLHAFFPSGDPVAGFQANVAGNIRSLAFWRGHTENRTSDDVIYFVSNLPDGGGVVGALRNSNGSTIATHQTARHTSTALALAQFSVAAAVTPVVRFSANPPVLGGLLQWNPDAGLHPVSVMSDDTTVAPFSATNPIAPQMVVITPNGQSHFAVARGTNGAFVSRRDLVAENSFNALGAFGGTFGPSPVVGMGLRRGSATAQPSLVVSAGGLSEQPSGVSVAANAPVVVDDTAHVWSHDGAGVVVTAFGSGSPGTSTFPGPVYAAPVLGQRGSKFDHVYFVNASGRLGLFLPATANEPMPDWAEQLPVSGQVVAPLTLDCDRSGSPYSFLYVATTAGDVLSVIAPSQKLAVDAPWPKFQRDTFNSGNSTLPHSSCP